MKLKASCTLTAFAFRPVITVYAPCGGLAQLITDQYITQPPVPITEYVDGMGNLCQRFVMPADIHS
jgi:hypothetical protein